MSKPFSIVARLASFRFAIRGLRTLIATEHNARVHLLLTGGVVVVGLALGLTSEDWRWAVLAIALVWMAEAFNTAIERLGDAVSTKHDARIGAAKDVAAGAVLLASSAAAIIGVSIFLPYLLALAGA